MTSKRRQKILRELKENLQKHVGHTVTYYGNGHGNIKGRIVRISTSEDGDAIRVWLESALSLDFNNYIYFDQLRSCSCGEGVLDIVVHRDPSPLRVKRTTWAIYFLQLVVRIFGLKLYEATGCLEIVAIRVARSHGQPPSAVLAAFKESLGKVDDAEYMAEAEGRNGE